MLCRKETAQEMAAQNEIAKSSVVFAWNSLASHINEASINNSVAATTSTTAATAIANRICEFEGNTSEIIGCS